MDTRPGTRLGSSPRMRGTRVIVVFLNDCTGIIPAYAGNTNARLEAETPDEDHPRVCGEHRNLMSSSRKKQGSSPRMRGTPASLPCGVRRCGIIPAYAGNTKPIPAGATIPEDHPRVCGEHHVVGVRGVEQPGIIPAYAGNTSVLNDPLPPRRDHPRVCGEHVLVYAFNIPYLGSSPRMRGTPQRPIPAACALGIIPAYAGNTPMTRFCCAVSRDHPRVCGEHTKRL